MKLINVKKKKVASAIYTTICALSTCTLGKPNGYTLGLRKIIANPKEGPLYAVIPLIMDGRLYVLKMEVGFVHLSATVTRATGIEIIPVQDPVMDQIYRSRLSSCRLDYRSGGVWIEGCVDFDVNIKPDDLASWLDARHHTLLEHMEAKI